MRVLQVASYFYPHMGGLETHVYNLSKSLVRRGHEVAIYASNIPPCERRESLDGIEVRRYDPVCEIMGNPIVPSMLGALLKARDFDIVHAHDEHALTANLAALKRSLDGRPLIVTSHGRLSLNGLAEKILLHLYERTMMRLTFRYADGVIALSESDRRYISGLGTDSNKIRVIPNAIDPSRYELAVDKESFLARYGLEGRRLILYTGQLLWRKGVQYLIDAMPEVLGEIRDARLVILGEGEYGRELLRRVRERRLQDYVLFLGRASEEELMAAFSSCDVFVLPSLVEGLPTVVLEAMFFGKPVVAAAIPGVVDYFNKTAYIVPPGSVKGLSEAIVDVLSDRGSAVRRGGDGRRLVEERFTWKRVINSVISMYEEKIECC